MKLSNIWQLQMQRIKLLPVSILMILFVLPFNSLHRYLLQFLSKFMIPLIAVYAAEYLINQGLVR